MVEYLIQYGANIKAKDKDGETALYEASKNGNWKSFESKKYFTYQLMKNSSYMRDTDFFTYALSFLVSLSYFDIFQIRYLQISLSFI